MLSAGCPTLDLRSQILNPQRAAVNLTSRRGPEELPRGILLTFSIIYCILEK